MPDELISPAEGGSVDPNAGEGSPPSFLESLPDDLRENETLESFSKADKPVEALARSYIEARSKIGANTVKVPGKNATDEEWGEYYKAIGVPDSPDGYEFPTENLPDVEITDEETQSIRQIAKDMGATPTQAAKLFRQWAMVKSESELELDKSVKQRQEQAVATLRKEWGQAFDQNTQLARQAVAKLADADTVAFLDDSGLGDHPGIIKMMAKIGRSMSEDEITGGGSGQRFVMTPADAKNEITRMDSDADTNKILRDKSHPMHKQMIEKRRSLYQAAYPEEA